MEKEYLGEVKSWEEIEKKAKELFEEGKIDVIKIISEEEWKQNLEKIYSLALLMGEQKLDRLKRDLECGKNNYSDSKKYNLYITSLFMMCSIYETLIIVCYK